MKFYLSKWSFIKHFKSNYKENEQASHRPAVGIHNICVKPWICMIKLKNYCYNSKISK